MDWPTSESLQWEDGYGDILFFFFFRFWNWMFTLAFFEKNLILHDMIKKNNSNVVILYTMGCKDIYQLSRISVQLILWYTMSTSIGKLDSIILLVVNKKKGKKYIYTVIC